VAEKSMKGGMQREVVEAEPRRTGFGCKVFLKVGFMVFYEKLLRTSK
jgi:hypothetical protein